MPLRTRLDNALRYSRDVINPRAELARQRIDAIYQNRENRRVIYNNLRNDAIDIVRNTKWLDPNRPLRLNFV